jgi:SAM-dependent methyltransferase
LNYKDPQYPIFNTLCPRCDLYERHRLQFLVMGELGKQFDFAKLSMLHFAPEPRFQEVFRGRFAKYQTADIAAADVDFQVDIRALPFANESFDVILASHVLEHVDDDAIAIREVHRVLKPNGFALLPIPIVSPYTIEYGAPNPREFGHVRAVGLDYFDRYRTVFAKVEVRQSADFPEQHQLYTYEDRTVYPNETAPLRIPMPGTKHPDFVPICYR